MPFQGEKFTFPTLSTPRLLLRELTLADAPAVFEHFADEAVTRYLDIEPCRSLQEAKDIIQFHMDDSGCRWGLFEHHSKHLVGTCGFHCWVPDQNTKAEIGYDLAQAYWGQGLMAEALAVALDFGFEAMDLAMIEATTEVANTRSIRLLGKCGFQQERALRRGLIYFWLEKAAWLNTRQGLFSRQ